MREKFIDSALLAGMVIICVVILYTLFSPPSRNFGRTTSSPQAENSVAIAPAENRADTELAGAVTAETADSSIAIESADTSSSEEVSAEDSTDIVPVAPLDDSADATESAQTDTSEPELTPSDSPADETTNLQDETSDAVEAEAGEASPNAATLPEVAPQPVPAGAFSLERVGFSFVTGGAGACSVVLEAWQHVAVSRDILERYPCGSEITVILDDPVDGRKEVTLTVADTMNPVNSRTVNIYVGEDEPALEYGVNTGRLEP